MLSLSPSSFALYKQSPSPLDKHVSCSMCLSSRKPQINPMIYININSSWHGILVNLVKWQLGFQLSKPFYIFVITSSFFLIDWFLLATSKWSGCLRINLRSLHFIQMVSEWVLVTSSILFSLIVIQRSFSLFFPSKKT